MKKALYLSVALMGSAWAEDVIQTPKSDYSDLKGGHELSLDDKKPTERVEFKLRKAQIERVVNDIYRAESDSSGYSAVQPRLIQPIDSAENDKELDAAIFPIVQLEYNKLISKATNELDASQEKEVWIDKAELVEEEKSLFELREVILETAIKHEKDALDARLDRLQSAEEVQWEGAAYRVRIGERHRDRIENAKKTLEAVGTVPELRKWVQTASFPVGPLVQLLYR